MNTFLDWIVLVLAFSLGINGFNVDDADAIVGATLAEMAIVNTLGLAPDTTAANILSISVIVFCCKSMISPSNSTPLSPNIFASWFLLPIEILSGVISILFDLANSVILSVSIIVDASVLTNVMPFDFVYVNSIPSRLYISRYEA